MIRKTGLLADRHKINVAAREVTLRFKRGMMHAM
jgi:hypothetical protein